MTTDATHETRIEADPALPVIRIVRDFDAPPTAVFRAWVEPELVTRWLGPDDTEMRVDAWDARTGGAYAYGHLRGGEVVAEFYGSFHEVREPSRIVQTFTYLGVPDGVSLETAWFEDLGDGRTRSVVTSVFETVEARDAMIASGMETGVVEGYAKLDRVLRSL